MHAHEHYHGGSDSILITTIGLILHSFADGLALGASLFCKLLLINLFIVSFKAEQSSQLGLIIFLAILMHKAPAAVGFGTFLHHEGLR